MTLIVDYLGQVSVIDLHTCNYIPGLLRHPCFVFWLKPTVLSYGILVRGARAMVSGVLCEGIRKKKKEGCRSSLVGIIACNLKKSRV